MWTCPKCETNNDGDTCLICGSGRPLCGTPDAIADRTQRNTAAAFQSMDALAPVRAALNRLWIWKIVFASLLLAVSLVFAAEGTIGLLITACSLALVIVAAQSNGKLNGCDAAIVTIAGIIMFVCQLILCPWF